MFLRQRAQRLRAELTLSQIREKIPNGWTGWHQIWHTCGDSSGNGYTPNKLPHETQGGYRGGGLGGQQFKSIGKLPNGWTDWHQLWFTSADSYGKGHRPNKSRPSIPQGAFWGGFRGSQIQKSGEPVKRLDRLAPHLVHVCGFVWEWISAKYNSPLNTPGAFRGVLGCHKLKRMGKLSNGWTAWHQIWHTCAVSSGNGYTPNKLPLETQGGTWGFYRVRHSKVWGSCQTAGPIGTNFGSRLRIHLEMDIRQTNCPSRHKGHLVGF